MKRLSDRVLVGVVGGLAGHIVKTTLNVAMKTGHLSKTTTMDKAAGMFIRSRKHPEPAARGVGQVADAVIASLFGVCITYMLSATGGDRATLKGALAGAAFWATIAGGLSQLGATVNHPMDPKSALAELCSHLVYGTVTAAVVERIGDPALFNGEIPLFQR